ncbi:hypothetical protein Tco_1500086 [Tanacetum coccineum]
MRTFLTSSLLSKVNPIDPKDSNGNIHPTNKGLPATNPDEGTRKSQPLLEGTTIDPKDSEGNTQPADKGLPSMVSDPDHNKEKTSSEVEPNTDHIILQTYGDLHMLIKDSEDELQDISDEEIYEVGEEMDEEEQHPVNSPFLHISPEPSPKASENPKKSKKRRVRRSQPDPSKASKKPKRSNSESSSGSLDFKAIDNNVPTTKRVMAVVEEYTKENADHKTQTDTSMSNTMDLIDKINKSRVDERSTLLKSLNRVFETLEVDLALKEAIQAMAETNTTTSSNITESLKEDLEFNLRLLKAAEGYRQNSARLTEISSSLKELIFTIENTQVTIQSNISSIKTNTSTMKEMGENSKKKVVVWKKPSSYTEGGSLKMVTKAKEPEVTEDNKEHEHEPQDTKPIPITIVRSITKTIREIEIIEPSSRPQLTDPILELTNKEIQAHMEKQERMERSAQESKLIELSKFELIKVVEKVATEAGREHLEKLKKSRELKRKRFNQYVWITNNRLKPENITNIHIHPNTKLVTIIVYKNNDPRNFDVYKSFKFGDFGVSEWDELSVIIPKKNNKVVGELLTSLTKKYEMLMEIPGELGINPSLPLLEEDPSLSLSRKTKAFELEPEDHITGLKCNRSLPEGIQFMNNKVTETPEHGIFFIDSFGDHTFQRRCDIHKVEVESLLGYIVMAGNVSTLENHRLPVLSLVLFKSVSKRWLSLINDTNFTLRRSRIPKLEPPSGLFMNFCLSDYDFLPFDNRIPIRRSPFLDTIFTFGSKPANFNVEILHSCNGLLLCGTLYNEIVYVYNPSITNMFKVIPKPDIVILSGSSVFGGMILAFDPVKSPHYKLIYGEIIYGRVTEVWIQIHIYSSETRNWSVCGDQYGFYSFNCFQDGIHWNDAIHWLNDVNGPNMHYKLHQLNEHPVLTTLHTPLTLDGRLYDERKLFESGGCLLFVGKDDTHSTHFTIYEMRNGYCEWSMKHVVNLDDTLMPLPKRWNIHSTVFCIVLGEREEDSFLVMELDKKVVQYKIVSKTLCTISHLGSVVTLKDCFKFIASFANV